ncbi:TetR/AcrR family transcriptional regulator [Aeromicrobium sp. IC_218]|uniref:TetR/AcrR family transcriptional regulator n=1 Tax=Aeromicrobium sp. IC_218 TaxID=2545468 RepID=UPI00103F1EE3|nr:TetR/AcrR family transcriptional regulator [Aeromicrobium sp. IC_218]TCI99475.1 TetR/AcrR family transcriptional regulator [Aeromicrobium sp. IC_218]
MALSQERREEIFSGALALVAEHGFDKVTMDQVADATRSSKATLYRQWGSKTALVVDALSCFATFEEPLPDTGTLRGDLLEMFEPREPKVTDEAELIGALLTATRTDPELAEAIRRQAVEPATDRVRALVDRAVERGEVAADAPALRHLAVLLVAPFVLHDAVMAGELTDEYVHDYVESVLLPALGVH